jgi:hypothetical protein
MSYTLKTTEATDTIATYRKYRFRLRSKNAHGLSDYSEEFVAAIAPLPGKFASV